MTYLRLRWVDDNESWLCFYELVLTLDEFDIRREIYKNGKQIGKREELVVALSDGPTRRFKIGDSAPCLRSDESGYFYDVPYRDGAHARWDSARLGNIPIKAMAIDGTLIDKPEAN